MILGEHCTGNNGTNGKVGKNGTLILNKLQPKPHSQTPILKMCHFYLLFHFFHYYLCHFYWTPPTIHQLEKISNNPSLLSCEPIQ